MQSLLGKHARSLRQRSPVEFYRAAHQELFEALGPIWPPIKVALVPGLERWPDFRLRLGNLVWPYEITTADKEGRYVGQEHKSDQAPAFHDWKADLIEVPSAIERAAQLKANKPYPSRSGLVIYVLIGDYDWSGEYGRDEVERAMHDVTSPAKDKFPEIWVRWGGRLYLLVGLRMPSGADGCTSCGTMPTGRS